MRLLLGGFKLLAMTRPEHSSGRLKLSLSAFNPLADLFLSSGSLSKKSIPKNLIKDYLTLHHKVSRQCKALGA
jgi:hypothetical protein